MNPHDHRAIFQIGIEISVYWLITKITTKRLPVGITCQELFVKILMSSRFFQVFGTAV